MPDCQTPPERDIVRAARGVLSAYSNMEELIRIGAYRAGSDPLIDAAIRLNPALEDFLRQGKDEVTRLDQAFASLQSILTEGAA
jgi:flagellum-specific ATP synthase